MPRDDRPRGGYCWLSGVRTSTLVARTILSENVVFFTRHRAGRSRPRAPRLASVRLVREFRAEYPLAELLLEEMSSQQAVLRVENGTVDLGISRLPMLQDAKVALITATTEPMMLLVPLDHPLAARSEVNLESLEDEDFIIYDLATAANMRAVSIIACQEAGFVPARGAERGADPQPDRAG